MTERPPVRRALESVEQGAGRTLVIIGPPVSGKSELLGGIREQVRARGWGIVALRGTYRDRMTPYAALADFGGPEAPETDRPVPPGSSGLDVPSWAVPPGGAYDTGLASGGSSGRSRRSRSEWGGGFPGAGGMGARRGGRIVSGSEIVTTLTRPPATGAADTIAVLVEEGSLLDSESRESLLHLSSRLRHWPILLTVVLDVSLPACRSWEEQLLGRGDVDWVRFTHPKSDPREEELVQERFAALPEATQRLVVFLALLGGSSTEVGLGRAARMGVRELSGILAPAIAVNLVRSEEGHLHIPHSAWISKVPTFVPEEFRRTAHLQIAESITALSPEPDSKRGRELAVHLFEAKPDARALRRLMEAAEFAERLLGYDATEELLTKALECAEALGLDEPEATDIELRWWHARSLIYSGRPAEGELEVRIGFLRALADGLPVAQIEERVDELLPALRALGPRSSLHALLRDLIDRLEPIPAMGAQATLQSVLVEASFEAGDHESAEREADLMLGFGRAAGGEYPRVTAIMAEAIQGAGAVGPGQRSEPFRDWASSTSSRMGHSHFERMASELWLRWVERGRHPAEAFPAAVKALPVLRKAKATLSELHYELAAAELALDLNLPAKAREPLARSRELADALHLLPPAPAVARLWLLDGRWAAEEERAEAARDAWGGLLRASARNRWRPFALEAHARLALLELSEGHPSAAEPHLGALAPPLGPVGGTELPEPAAFAASAAKSRRGAGVLPSRSPD